MRMKKVSASPSQFHDILALELQLTAASMLDKILLVLFTSAIDGETGRPWCSDCEKGTIQPAMLPLTIVAQPLLLPHLIHNPRVTVIECLCEKEAYSDPRFPYRLDPLIQLERIPTLIHWKVCLSHLSV